MFSNLLCGRKNATIEPIVWDENQSDPRLFYKPVDEYTSRAFAQNYGGYPRSDVALLNEQTDLTAVNWLLDRLAQRPGDGVGDDVSDFDLSISHKSKYCQTASEMINHYENLLKVRDDRELECMDSKEREKAAKEFEDRRSRLRETLTSEEKEYLRKQKRQKEIESLIDV